MQQRAWSFLSNEWATAENKKDPRELGLPPRHSTEMEAARGAHVVKMFVKALRVDESAQARTDQQVQANVIAAPHGGSTSFNDHNVVNDVSSPMRRRV